MAQDQRKKFSTHWKRSTEARKQRLYRYNAPLHIKQKFMHVHLSPELRKKHGVRKAQLRKGDKVKILRGKFKGKENKVDRVLLKKERVYITGMEIIKKDGNKLPVAFHPSNLMIVILNMDDKRRGIERKETPGQKTEKSPAGRESKEEAKNKRPAKSEK